jgi:segregation and condensation protein B
MSLKSKIEAIIYAAEEPVTLDQITELVAAETGDEPKRAVKATLDELIQDYAREDRGMEIRHVANGFRMATKPEHHDAVRAFAKSLKPPIRLSLPALETLAVIAYKQPVTAPEIGEIRGVDASGVLGTLIDRKLITTAGRKDVIGRPILYKTTKEFLLRFGLNDMSELPSMEEFEKLARESDPSLFDAIPDATGVAHVEEPAAEQSAVSDQEEQPSAVSDQHSAGEEQSSAASPEHSAETADTHK